MGQKSHPIGLRVLKWENEWYSNYKTNSSQLTYQIYNIKYLLIFFFYKKEFLIHSFSSKYIDNSFYLTINIVPIYRNYNYSLVNSIKRYNKKLIFRKYKLATLFNKDLNFKTNIKIFKKVLFLKKLFYKNSYKSLSYSFNNSLILLRNIKENLFFQKFKKLIKKRIFVKLIKKNSKNLKQFKEFGIQKYYLKILIRKYFLKNLKRSTIKLNPLISLKNFKFMTNSLSKFQNSLNCILDIKNISKSCYISNSFFQKTSLYYRFYIWMYYFHIIHKLSPSSLLLAYIIKKFLETRSLRKKQRSFLKNLKRYLRKYAGYLLLKQIKGIKIHVKGRINKRNRSFIYKMQIGSVPLSTISQKILYTFCPAFTIYGSFGIKVWIALKCSNQKKQNIKNIKKVD